MRATGLLALLLATQLADDPAAQGGRVPSGREGGPVRRPKEDKVEGFDEELSYYKRRITSRAFHLRTRARDRIAGTRDPRALQLLIGGYNKPENPKAFVQYICASLAAQYFEDVRFLPAFASWRSKHQKNQDAWLWYRTLAVHLERKDSSELIRVATGKHKPFLRGAAVHAMGSRPDITALPFIGTILDSLPRDPVERAVLVEGLGKVMQQQAYRLGDKEFQTPVSRLIHQMDAKETLYRTKLTIARHLMRLFKSDDLIIEADPWLRRLAHNTGPEDKYKDRYAQPTFMGIKGTGKMIGYVIDMSDSMLKPVKVPADKKKVQPKGPVTGPKPEDEKKPKTIEEEIPWAVVRNRFDLAREYLKASLRGLQSDMHFCIVYFGTKAAPLKSTPGLIAATPANVKKAIKELDGIKPGLPKGDRKHGTLRGNTNLHGGIHRIFKARRKKLVGDDEYVDKKAFLEGCDTIFILSDGEPTYSDWPTEEAQPDKWDPVGDPETGTRQTPPEGYKVIYHGPYHDWRYLVDDVRRLNLFRQAEIHCIGIGEARQRLLNRIAEHGFGKVKMVKGM